MKTEDRKGGLSADDLPDFCAVIALARIAIKKERYLGTISLKPIHCSL